MGAGNVKTILPEMKNNPFENTVFYDIFFFKKLMHFVNPYAQILY